MTSPSALKQDNFVLAISNLISVDEVRESVEGSHRDVVVRTPGSAI